MALLFAGMALLPVSTYASAGGSPGLVLMPLMVGLGLWHRHDWARGGAVLLLLGLLFALVTPMGASVVAEVAGPSMGTDASGPDLVSCLAILLGGLLLRLMSRDMRREFALATLDEARRLAHLSLDARD